MYVSVHIIGLLTRRLLLLQQSGPGALAVVRGHREVVKFCLGLEHGLAANKQVARYRIHMQTGVENPIISTVTLVMIAAIQLHVGLLKLLLEKGADATAVDSERCNAFSARAILCTLLLIQNKMGFHSTRLN